MNIKLLYWTLFIPILLVPNSIFGQSTYIDNFNTTSYTNNNGNSSFTSNWIETNDDGSPSSGNIQVNPGAAPGYLRFKNLDSGQLHRFLDLTDMLTVTVTISFVASSGNSVYLDFYDSASGTWQFHGNIYAGITSDTYVTTMPVSLITSNSGLRFRGDGSNWANNAEFFINSVSISAEADPCNPATSGNLDSDGDGISNVCDLDDDNDGISDCVEKGILNGGVTDAFTFSGNTQVLSSQEFQLTDELNDQIGIAMINNKINFNRNFSFSFDVFLGYYDMGADGITIVFHNDPNGVAAIGASGDGMGARGIQDGIVLEIDTYNNGSTIGDITNDHGMIWDSDNQSGTGLLTSAVSLGNIEDGNWHTVTVNWVASTNTITYYVGSTLAGSYTGDIVNNYFGGSNLVHFGFTSSTGGFNNVQKIRFTSVCDIPIFQDTDGDGLPNEMDIDSDDDGIPDNIEAQTTLGYILPSGVIDMGSGLYTNYGTGLTPIDTDGDGIFDMYDTNSDSDNLLDIEENGMGNSISGTDTDNDGLDDAFETTNANDSSWDVNEDIENPSNLSILPDTDGDLYLGGDIDYRDLFNINPPAVAYLDFDGVDDFLTRDAFINGNTEITVMAWVKSDIGNTTDMVLISEDEAFKLWLQNGSTPAITINTLNAGKTTLINSSSIPLNEWHHLAVTYSATYGTLILFIDGEQVALQNLGATGEPLTLTANSINSFELGRLSSDVSNKLYFHGGMDEVRIFNRALTPSQIQEMVYQEIEIDFSSSLIKGSVIPKIIKDNNTGDSIAWADLLAYYPMTDILTGWTQDFSNNVNNIKLRNITTIEAQNVPMPYVSGADGTWGSANTWLHGDVWDIDNEATNKDWSIVKISNNITTSTTHNTLGLIIDAGNTLTVSESNAISNSWYLELNGSIDLLNDSQLIQTSESDLVTSANGKILRRQEGASNAFWYNYWSSPVGFTGTTVFSNNNAATNNANNTGYNLNMIKDGTGAAIPFTSNYTGNNTISTSWLYTYKNGVGYADWSKITPSTTIAAGVGYTQKGTGSSGAEQQYIFEGKPNNGTILINAIDKGGSGSVPSVSQTSYLLGNPYPSALDIDKFIDDNASVISGSIQLWQQWSGSSHYLNEYNGGYAIVNKLGSVRAYQFQGTNGETNGSQDGTLSASKYLPVGQGFVVEIVADGTLEFNNDQRLFIKEADANGTFNNGSVFFKANSNKSKTATSVSTNKDVGENEFMKFRLQLNAVSGPQTKRELLLGFSKKTTDGVDYGYDAENKNINNNDIHLHVDGKEMNIAAYSPITYDKEIPLSFKSSGSNGFTLQLTHLENIDESQDIFLKDNLLGIYHNLRNEEPYTFTSEMGEFNTRFQIVFQSQQEALGIEEESTESNFIYYIGPEHKIYAKKMASTVEKFSVLNMKGQVVYELSNIPTEQLEQGIALPNFSAGAYVACFRTKNGRVKTIKVIVD